MGRLGSSCLLAVLAPASMVSAASPQGRVEEVACTGLQGVALDPDVSSPTYVALYSDRDSEWEGGSSWGWFVADGARPDLPAAEQGHGFSIALPPGLANGRPHRLWLYAIDVSGDAHTPLGAYDLSCGAPAPVVPRSPPPAATVYSIDPRYVLGRYIDRLVGSPTLSEADFQRVSAWQFFLVALQGLVNRAEPRIYVLDTTYDVSDTGLELWQPVLEAKLGAPMVPVPEDDPLTLAEWLAQDPAIAGVVLYDPGLWTDLERGDLLNYLTAYCAVHDCLPVTVELRAALIERGVDWPLLFDFSDEALLAQNGLTSAAGIYRAMVDGLWAASNHSVLAYLHPQLFVLPRDYLFAHKILPVFIRARDPGDPSPSEEPHIDKLWRLGLPLGGHVLGQAGSHNTDWIERVFTQYMAPPLLGKYGEELWDPTSRAGVSLDYIHASPNLSLHSGVTIAPLARRRHTPPPLEDKVYLTFSLSDGDNLSWHKQLWTQAWLEMEHDLPLNWTFNPLMLDLAPAIVEWFYANASDHDYLMPIGGAGSIYSVTFGDDTADATAAYATFVAQSCAYLEALDQRLMYVSQSCTETAKLAAWASSGCFDAVFADYNVSLGTCPGLPAASYEAATYREGDTGVFRSAVGLAFLPGEPAGRQAFLDTLAQRSPATRPAFINVWVLGNEALSPYLSAAVREALAALDPATYEAVTADDFVALYRRAEGITCDGPCWPGQVETVACGECGTRSRACQDDCQWGSFDACGGADPGSTCDTGELGVTAPEDTGGCGCQGGGATSGWLLALGWLGRRRGARWRGRSR